jgi:hypothetical protein
MKRYFIAIIAVVLLAVLAIALSTGNKKGTLRTEIGNFAIIDTSTVTRIYMADMQGNEVDLKKTAPGHWSLNDSLTARRDGIELLLNTMNRIVVKAPVARSAYNTVIKRLATTSIKTEVYQIVPRINIFNLIKLFPREKRTKVYYVGSATPDNQGSFMLMEGSDTPFVVYMPGLRGYVSARYSAFTSDWRDHTIFAVRPSQVRAVEINFPAAPIESFRLDKFSDSEVKITQLETNQVYEKFDTTRVVELINAFRNIRYEAAFEKLEQSRFDSITAQMPLHIIKITDVKGTTQKVTTYRRANIGKLEDPEGNLYPYDVDRLYAVMEKNNEPVIVQYFVFDPITRPLSFLLGREFFGADSAN